LNAFINENDCYIKCHSLCKATRDYMGEEDYFLPMRDVYDNIYFH
jgi:hypothetical protein